jgi:hypothetical protein
MPQIIAAVAVSFLFIFAWLGADWATRFQYLVMAILSASLASFFIGGITNWDSAILEANWASPPTMPGFWILFAIFFPAVTGFTQGVSMSGDLKDPGKSLPLGTFLAVGISLVVYFGAAVVFSASLPGDILAGDLGAMERVSSYGFLINAGVIAATLSSAMASFLGAPRILQSLASDRIFPFLLFFAKGTGPMNNPRRGVLFSTAIAFAVIGLGELNLIAPVVSMFFLISYGLLNYATYFEARASSPSFRPRFRWFDARLSLLGWLTCLGAMMAIDIRAGLVAISLLFAIYQYLKRTAGPARWADSRRSYYLQRVRENLLTAASEAEHPRDWRPHILALSDDASRRGRLLRLASWLEGGSGLTTLVRLLEGDGIKMTKLKEEAEEELRMNIHEHGSKAFPLVISAPDLQVAFQTLVQASGIGPLHMNTILLNWLDKLPRRILDVGELRFMRHIRPAFRYGCNIVILDADKEEWETLGGVPAPERTIDVWWWDNRTSHLMLLLAYLMTRHEAWEEAKIRVLAPCQKTEKEKSLESLKQYLTEVRIEAEPLISEEADLDALVDISRDASIVFIPFRMGRKNLLGPFDASLDDLFSRLSVVVTVLAAEDIELDAEPEEGKAGELAAAMDALAEAEKKVREAESIAEKASKEALKRMSELESATKEGADSAFMKKVSAAVEAKEEAGKAGRKAAKALAKMEEAVKAAEALGMKREEEDASDQDEHKS